MLAMIGDRRSGKTTALIRLSELTGARIVCPNADMARCVARQARDMGVGIPQPISFERLAYVRPSGPRAILIDELGGILRGMGCDCLAVTIGWEDVMVDAGRRPTLRECLRLWWDGRGRH